MQNLNHDLKVMSQRNRDGSYATQSDRERILKLIGDQLREGGFNNLRATGIRPKHIEYLVTRWQEEGLSAGTLKNRMAVVRWLAEKLGKENMVARENITYGIADRQHVTNISKATVLDPAALARVTDPYTAYSLRLQEAFGLRREESIKIRPNWSDQVVMLALKASWTKGGREREIPILTDAQRALLDEVKRFTAGKGQGSLIPADMTYKEQLNRFKAQTAQAGILHVHGLRHGYAQMRYEQLTGWKAPAAGGPTSKQLNVNERLIDRYARLTISRELGHGREQITAVYLGR